MDRFKEFEQRIKSKLADVNSKVSHLHDTTGILKDSFQGFKSEMYDMMKYITSQKK